MFVQKSQQKEQSGKNSNQSSQNNSFIQKKKTTPSTNMLIQPKLQVGQPDDKYEKEADTIASKVMNMSNPTENPQTTTNSISSIPSTKPQRKALANSITPIVQKASNSSSQKNTTSSDISQKLTSRNGKGDRMDTGTQNFMESRFGTSFNNVRIHKDASAVQMSQDLSARAFTNGNNIYFNKGQYSPNSQSGKQLLAHELTHTIQQKGANSVQRAIIQKQAGESKNLKRLREILDYFDIPESEVIEIFEILDKTESNTALNDPTLKEQASSALDNEEMFSAMRYSNGDLNKRLKWMFYEGTSWEDVKTMLDENPGDFEEIRKKDMRAHFAEICDNDTMVEAVDALGGELNFKLNWMAFEGASAENVYDKIRSATKQELGKVLADDDTLKQLKEDFSESTYNRIVEMLNGLLVWDEIDEDKTERHFEDNDNDGVWEEEEFSWNANYDIEYHRDKLKIIVRIQLDGETVPAATQAAWLGAIRNRWNGHFHIQGTRRLSIVFEPIFTDDDNHTSVDINSGAGRANSDDWYLSTPPDTVAHEFGHLIGLEDEYWLSAAEYTRLIGSNPTAPGSTAVPHAPSGGFSSADMIMQDGTGNVQRRHLSSYVSWLNSKRLPGEAVYALRLGP